MVVDKIKELLEPIARRLGQFILDVTYKREGGKRVLRIVLDKPGGITMDECARLNNELNELLDGENIIEEEYLLEVSSPGADRKLEKGTDFVWAMGKKIKVTTYTPLDGKNTFSGILVGLGDSTVVVDENGTVTEIPLEKIANARLNASEAKGNR